MDGSGVYGFYRSWIGFEMLDQVVDGCLVVFYCAMGGDACNDGVEWVVRWESGHSYEGIVEHALY